MPKNILKTHAGQNSQTDPNRRKFLKSVLQTGFAATLSSNLYLNGCSRGKNSQEAFNILLISIDTLRADHTGCYGYHRDTSPNIDRFAAESLLYTKAYAPTPWTLPSHVAMLTGIHPFTLRISTQNSKIPQETPMFAESLKNAGYQTAAFVDSPYNGFVGDRRGFDRGFDTFNHYPHKPNLKFKFEMAATAEVAEKWLKNRDKTKPFFLFLHTKSVHTVAINEAHLPQRFPYDKPEPYRTAFLTPEQANMNWGHPGGPGAQSYLHKLNELFATGKLNPRKFSSQRIEALKGQYDGGILYMDKYLGLLLDALETMGLADNTMVILTSDHGEAFLEHRFFMHIEVYKPLLHIPLIIRLPYRSSGKIIENPVALEDIVPTMHRFSNTTAPNGLTGIPLPMDQQSSNRKFYSYYQFGKGAYYDAFSLLQDDWKLVYHKYPDNRCTSDLYNLKDDPDELNPITELNEKHKIFQNNLIDWIASAPNSQGDTIQLDPKTIEHLKSLGYVD